MKILLVEDDRTIASGIFIATGSLFYGSLL